VREKTLESENRLVPGISKESKSKNQPVPGIQKKYHFLGISKPLKEPPVFRKELQGPPVKAACIAIIQAASVDWPIIITNCLPMTEHLFISYHMCFILSDLKCNGSTTSSSRNHLGSANGKE
jgi:hypothetical protein